VHNAPHEAAARLKKKSPGSFTLLERDGSIFPALIIIETYQKDVSIRSRWQYGTLPCGLDWLYTWQKTSRWTYCNFSSAIKLSSAFAIKIQIFSCIKSPQPCRICKPFCLEQLHLHSQEWHSPHLDWEFSLSCLHHYQVHTGLLVC